MLGRKSKIIRDIQEVTEMINLSLEKLEKVSLPSDLPDKKNKSHPLDKFDKNRKKLDKNRKKLDILFFEGLLGKLNAYLKKHPHRVVNNDFRRDQIKDIANIIYEFFGIKDISMTSILGIKNLWPSKQVKEEKKYFPISSDYQISLTDEKDNIKRAIQEIEAVLERVNEESGKQDRTLRKLFSPIFNDKKNNKVIKNVYQRFEKAVSERSSLLREQQKRREDNQKTLLLSIPSELLVMIMFYLEAQDKINAGLASTALYEVSSNEELWKHEVQKNNMVKYDWEEISFKNFFFKHVPLTFLVINDCSSQKLTAYDSLSFVREDLARVVGQVKLSGRECKLFNSLRAAKEFSASLREGHPDEPPIYIIEFALPMNVVRAGLNRNQEVYEKLTAVHPEKNSDNPIVNIEVKWAYKAGVWRIHCEERKAEENIVIARKAGLS